MFGDSQQHYYKIKKNKGLWCSDDNMNHQFLTVDDVG